MAVGSGLGRIEYTGGWEQLPDPAKFGGSDHFTHRGGDTATLRFRGVGFVLRAAKDSHHGQGVVIVDGGAPVTVDFHAKTRVDDAVVYTSPALPDRDHTVVVASKGSGTIAIDRFTIAATAPGTAVPPGAPATSAPMRPPTSMTASIPPRFPWPPTGTAGFITRDGTRLLLNGGQYKFAGLNADTWFGCWSDEVPTDADLDRYFRELNPRSMTRIWPMPGADLEIMDRIVSAAEKHGQFLAVTLLNGNDDCTELPPPSYTPGSNGEELAHVTTIVSRYANSPAIGFWEIINEPDGGHPDLKGFYEEMSHTIKAADPNHLVASGAHAAWNGGEDKYIADHDAPSLDLISMHEYDAETGISHWGEASARAARALNKPWYAGEDGFCCGAGDTGSYEANADKLEAEWAAYLAQPECAGMLYWDFKLGHPETATVRFDTPMWATASSFRHPYLGG